MNTQHEIKSREVENSPRKSKLYCNKFSLICAPSLPPAFGWCGVKRETQIKENLLQGKFTFPSTYWPHPFDFVLGVHLIILSVIKTPFSGIL